jgi:hypothetical protein
VETSIGRRALIIGLAVVIAAGIAGAPAWSRWKAHERGLALRDAEAIKPTAPFVVHATVTGPGSACSDRSTHDNQVIACYTAQYDPPSELLDRAKAMFEAAGLTVSGAQCEAIEQEPQVCDVWVDHHGWYARATFVSGREVPAPAAIRKAEAAGTPPSTFLRTRPHQAWSGLLVVSTNY